MSNTIDEIVTEARQAVEFLDICKRDRTSIETGGMRDAKEWIESVVRKLAEFDPETSRYQQMKDSYE